jgi:hypothetical protein
MNVHEFHEHPIKEITEGRRPGSRKRRKETPWVLKRLSAIES